MLFSTLKYPLAITALALLGCLLFGGLQMLIVVGILIVLEVSLSFDNAVVNAKILGQMSPYWQKIFLTVGVAIAVFGMRLVFPLAVVSVAGSISPANVLQLALWEPARYATILTSAHAAIAAFGGIFLLMIFLDWLFEDRDIKWLQWIERPMARIGKMDYLPAIVSLTVLGVSVLTFAHHHLEQVVIAGIFGLIAYLVISSLSKLFEEGENAAGSAVVKTGKAAFFAFLYLELLDASFSFDGVIGAFAVSNQILVIALGLGVGALYIRSLTVYLVRKGTLNEYVHLEHGAHYAIGALAITLLVSISVEVPEVVSGLIGAGFILVALATSVWHNKYYHGQINNKTSRVLPQ